MEIGENRLIKTLFATHLPQYKIHQVCDGTHFIRIKDDAIAIDIENDILHICYIKHAYSDYFKEYASDFIEKKYRGEQQVVDEFCKMLGREQDKKAAFDNECEKSLAEWGMTKADVNKAL